MSRRVAITGMGIICPSGNSLDEAWGGVVRGTPSIDLITQFDCTNFSVKIAGEVKNFSMPETLLAAKEQSRYDRFVQFSLLAADQAMEQAGLNDNFGGYDPSRIGTIIGVGIGGFPMIEDTFQTMIDKGPRRVSPFFIPAIIPNMAPGLISVAKRIKGVNYSVSSACASAAHAISAAAGEIISGRQDVIISGGAESSISQLTNSGFANMKALSRWNDRPQESSRPFDSERNGFVLGEGAGVLVLEEVAAAKARGATIFAEIAGYGATSDAHHITAPHPEGDETTRCMNIALADAGISPSQVGYINAHGTSTPLGDKSETMAIRKAFGKHADDLFVSSTKSSIGHLLGAAGGVESIFCVMSLCTGKIPPTINLQNPDPECDLNYVPNKSIKTDIEYALSNSFGFGGTNASLIFKKHTA